jgi:glutamate--cysteine ligase
MEALLTETHARPALTRDDLLSPFYGALTPPDLWRVGTEAEKFGLLRESLAPLPYEGERSVKAVLQGLEELYGWFPEYEYQGGALISLKRGQASITLEPGAQLELSGAPFASIHDTKLEWDQHLAEINVLGEKLGIVWLGLGFHPLARQSDLSWVPKLRYGIMREYLPTRGSMGLDMMRRTCTVQANLDYSSEADAMQKMRIALGLSPIITAMFANSPFVEGQVTGERSHRAKVWLNTDPDRAGLLPFMRSDTASFERYVEWALDVPMFMVKRDGKAVHNTGQTFRAFLKDGFSGVHATLDDWVAHLGTLFPEVRLKKTIEIRGADSLSAALTPALPALSKGLLYDAQALAQADALASRISPEAAEAAREDIGKRGLRAELAGREVAEWASDVLAIALGGLERFAVIDPVSKQDERVHLAPLAALVERKQTPADALLEGLNQAEPLGPQLLELARL